MRARRLYGAAGLSRRNFSKTKRGKTSTQWLFGEFCCSRHPSLLRPYPCPSAWHSSSDVEGPSLTHKAPGKVLIRTCGDWWMPDHACRPRRECSLPCCPEVPCTQPLRPGGSSRGGMHLHLQQQSQLHPCPAGPNGYLRGRWRPTRRRELQGSGSQQSPERLNSVGELN